MILGVHHVAISVPDLERAVAFYCGVLDFEEVLASETHGDSPQFDAIIGLKGIAARMRMLKAHNTFIEVWQYAHPRPALKAADYPANDHGIPHFCLQVRDIEHEHARLSAAGMRFMGPPQDLGTMAAIYGRDPFGNIIELFEAKDPSVPSLVPMA